MRTRTGGLFIDLQEAAIGKTDMLDDGVCAWGRGEQTAYVRLLSDILEYLALDDLLEFLYLRLARVLRRDFRAFVLLVFVVAIGHHVLAAVQDVFVTYGNFHM